MKEAVGTETKMMKVRDRHIRGTGIMDKYLLRQRHTAWHKYEGRVATIEIRPEQGVLVLVREEKKP
jgi:hypothetical protein